MYECRRGGGLVDLYDYIEWECEEGASPYIPLLSVIKTWVINYVLSIIVAVIN